MKSFIFSKLNLYRKYRLYHLDNRRPHVNQYKKHLLDPKHSDENKIYRLTVSLYNNGVRVSKIPDEWWVQLLLSINHQVESKEFIQKTQSLPAEHLNAAEWLEFSSMLIGVTFYRTALIIRKKALEKAVSYASSGLYRFIYADMILGAALEKLDYKLIRKALKYSQLLGARCGQNLNIQVLKSLIEEGDWRYFGARDRAYKNIVSGKTIAIIGPLNDESKTEEEINGFDLVVKLNVLDLNKLQDSKLRTDLIYNSNPIMHDFAKNYHNKMIKKPLAIVCRAPHFFKSLKGTALFRSIPCLNAFTFNGGLNMLQRVIIDLSRFQPAKIKVFGSDLYASLDYSVDYQAGVNEGEFSYYADQMVQHDLISQFVVTKHLHEFSCFEGDKGLEEILALGLDGYLRRMQSIYRPYVLTSTKK